jgi:hypothetical protein
MKNIVAVVGGGAAGLMAAYQAAVQGACVTLFERNPNLGRKILISGKGRCNLTNIKNMQEFIENIPGNGKFLYSALARFSNNDLIAFFEKLGVPTKVERGGRVFPQSDRSIDVVKAMEAALVKAGVSVKYKSRVRTLAIENGRVRGLKLYNSDEQYFCDRVVVATGGLSYPATGSTGDGYELARQAGHTVTRLIPSLVPLVIRENWVKELQGLSLRNIEVSVFIKGKQVASKFGEMVFTHFGVSGPVILTLSRDVVEHLGSQVTLSINLKPALSEKELDARLLRDFKRYERRIYKNALTDLLPEKLIPVFVECSGIEPDKPVNQITREERRKIIETLRGLRLSVIGCMEREAIVTRGGVSIREIDPKTMESRLVKGLFFAGEVLDVDGLTGGYNLQAAFSTGYLAGIHAAVNE